jgi:hypothetical protein
MGGVRFMDGGSLIFTRLEINDGTRANDIKRLSEIRILFLDKRNQIIADDVQQTSSPVTSRS